MESLNEDWKDVENYEGYYQISSLGRVRSVTRLIIYKTGKRFTYKSRILKQRTDKDGYLRITLNKECKLSTMSMHRLVAIHFIPNPDNLLQVNHLDGDKTNNSISNLEWCNVYDNLKHSYREGLKKTKLNEQDVKDIKELYKLGKHTQKQIGELYGVNKEHINGIINNKKRTKV